jgi:hypothetical protein
MIIPKGLEITKSKNWEHGEGDFYIFPSIVFIRDKDPLWNNLGLSLRWLIWEVNLEWYG